MKRFHKMAAITLALSTCLLSACSNQSNHTARYRENPITRNVFAMNTYNTFTVYDDISGDVLESAENQLKALESLWSVTDEQIAELMQYVGYDKISLSENTVNLLPGMEIDLGAVAKGYACSKRIF